MMGSGLRPRRESKGFSDAWTIQYILFDDPAPGGMEKRHRRPDSEEKGAADLLERIPRALRNFLLWLLG